MHWIAADLLMFVSSVVLYLLIRKAALVGVPSTINNLAMFGVPAIIFSVLILTVPGDLTQLNAWLWFMLIVTAVGLAYFSSAASMLSVERAPNPGYSLVISKSAVILTVLLAVPLFGVPLTPLALFAVLLIVVFSMLIMVNPGQSRGAVSTSWLPLALFAFVGWAFLALSAKYLFMQGVSTAAFLFVLFVLVAGCILIEIRYKRVSWFIVREHPLLFVGIGILSAIWNFFLFYAISVAPNPGYINATNAASIAVVAVLATIFFKDEFSVRKLTGVCGVIAGLCLLFIG